MMERQRPQSKVSLEDLIRLKRAERPPQEFWSEFESQLRHKQLAAIVDKRPWWRRFSMANVAKLSLPVGATAIVALTLTSFRERFHATPSAGETITAFTSSAQSDATSAAADTAGALANKKTQAELLASTQVEANAAAHLDVKPAAGSRAHADLVASSGADDVLVSQAEKEMSLAQVILGIEDNAPEVQPRFEETVLIASSSLAGGASDSHHLGAQETPALAGLASSIDARRARLLVSVDSPESTIRKDNSRVARTRDRIASRLNEQALSDSIRRLGLNGDSVSIKF
jgi:hypothetical protein